jgi:tRNA 5-methylaminomethyl-2-thiouridine biosynthesis bifunctional protein
VPVVVFASGAADPDRFQGHARLRTDRVRGAVTSVPADESGPRTVVHDDGFVLPAVHGKVVAGGSYDQEQPMDVFDRLSSLGVRCDAAKAEERIAHRAVTPDRLPVIGALPDDAAITPNDAGLQLTEVPRCSGLYAALGYGSRGLIWSSLGAELLAAVIEGEPQPVEGKLADAVDPARFALKALRKGR